MNTVSIDDKEFIESSSYQKFMEDNPGRGNLKIRAYAASEALPVSGLHIVVSTIFDDEKIVFFDGVTDASGMIEKLSLPAPKLDLNNLVIPNTIIYKIIAYSESNNKQEFSVSMYDGICVVQNINFVPGRE